LEKVRKSNGVAHESAPPIDPRLWKEASPNIRRDIQRDPFEGYTPGNAAFGKQIQQIGDLTIAQSFSWTAP